MKDYEKWFLEKYDHGEEFDEEELKELRWELEEVATSYGENRRWSRTVTNYFKVGDRYFSLDWEEGLTEYQPDEFFEQPVEVEKYEHEETIIVTNWIEKPRKE